MSHEAPRSLRPCLLHQPVAPDAPRERRCFRRSVDHGEAMDCIAKGDVVSRRRKPSLSGQGSLGVRALHPQRAQTVGPQELFEDGEVQMWGRLRTD
mmetsp:Transcript_63748/g.184900  ORF Transcript_63748/g.184900 Transcript_63748/m.184900 type:complete len:96 (+) Transcript_63748:376-663(+)